jgi:hypothetical protein
LRAAAILFGVLIVLLAVTAALMGNQTIPPAELLRRCQASVPAWNGYQEDIKEIGANPVAQWRGTPSLLRISAGRAHLHMALEAPWDGWEASLPLLLKTPEGHVQRNSSAVSEGGIRVYQFQLSTDGDYDTPPWVDIQYPHTKRRLHLNAEGRWQADDPGAEDEGG